MTRTENDLLAALRELEQRADQHGAPSVATVLDAAADERLDARRSDLPRRFPRWLPPLAAAAAVAATAITAVALTTQHSGSPHGGDRQAGGPPTAANTAARHSSLPGSPTTSAATILDGAAAALDAAPAWTAPAPREFFYIRTNQATTWTSVSGRKSGDGRVADGTRVWVPGCVHGRIVSSGEAGPCTLNDVPHYLRDAPTAPAAWDAYLERMAPGAKAADAQGKIIAQVLHEDLIAPEAAAALLRYTVSCPGLHTFTVRPVAGKKLVGVTCTSMTNGSYGLLFDAVSHDLVGFVGVGSDGRQDGSAEIIRQTGVVTAIGRTP